MLVRYWMTESPWFAIEDMTLDEALGIMRRNRVRRLPVVRGKKLIGIVALSDLYRYIEPRNQGKASLPEDQAGKLHNIRVGEVMTHSPFTCERNTSLEEVGALMRRKKIGAVPVVDRDELVGIITESDILGALASIARMGSDGRRICFRIPVAKKMETFYEIVSLCEKNRLEILTLLTHPIQGNASHLVMLRVRGDRVEEFIDTLWKNHYEVLVANAEQNTLEHESMPGESPGQGKAPDDAAGS
ncbi:MAG: CBS domain-containing protein [Syntrophales bacterium]